MSELSQFASIGISIEEKSFEVVEPLHHLSKNRKKTYHKDTVRQIQISYIIASILWVLLIFICRLYETGPIGLLILTIPLVIFAINYQNASKHTTDLESEMFQGNFLSFGFLITSILINWQKLDDKRKYFKLLMIALILLMLSLVDIWVDKDNFIIIKHIRSILETSALLLLAYTLYLYYFDVMKESNKNKGE